MSIWTNLDNYLYSVFKDVWVGSLIHERNPNKSPNLHVFHTGGKFDVKKFVFTKSILCAVRKYFIFLFCKIYFSKCNSIDKNNIVFSYFMDHLLFLTKNINCIEIVIPQNSNYKKIKKANMITIFSFLKYIDFIQVSLLYLYYMIRFLLINDLYIDTVLKGNLYKNDSCRSFVGDVCVESLFYPIIFRRINKLINDDSNIYYVYEGQGWEKLLCKYIAKAKKTGVLCSIIHNNLFNFFYYRDNILKDIIPDKLAVLGPYQKEQFNEFPNDVFIYGAGRYLKYFNVLKSIKRKGNILVMLPFEYKEALALLSFIKIALLNRKDVIVRYHPMSAIKNNIFKKSTKTLDKELARASIVIIAGDTSVGFNALAAGCLVVVVKLKEFLSLSLLEDVEQCLTISEPQELKEFVNSGVKKACLAFKNTMNKRDKLICKYFDLSADELKMTTRIING